MYTHTHSHTHIERERYIYIDYTVDQENVFSAHKHDIQILEGVQFFLRTVSTIKYMYITHKVKKVVWLTHCFNKNVQIRRKQIIFRQIKL